MKKSTKLYIFISLLSYTISGIAFEWQDLWNNKDQKGYNLFHEGDYQKASDAFADKKWQAMADIKATKFKDAIEKLDQFDDVESIYNKGNALALDGHSQEAITAYQTVLEQEPGHEDARYNLEILEKVQEEKEKNQGSCNKNKEDNKKEEDDKQKEEQDEQKSAKNKDQENKEKEDKSQESAEKKQQNQNQAKESEQKKETKAAQKKDETAKKEQEKQQASKTPQEQKDQDKEKSTASYDEKKQATEQWLNRIPDDPGGLLRQKFIRDYKERIKG